MSDFDTFASQLLEESKRFLELASDSSDAIAKEAFLHAALMVGFCALEAHVSAIASDFTQTSDLTVHELGFMQEKRVSFKHGSFQLSESLSMVRLDERIEFLHCKFSGQEIDRKSTWWAALGSASKLRNELTHPKNTAMITETSVRQAIQAIVDTLNALYNAIYKRPLPVATLALQSKLDFG